MNIYPDTSVIASLQLRDSFYADALRVVQTSKGVLWTPWQKVEFYNSMRARVWRKALTLAELRIIENNMRAMLLAGDLVWRHIPAYSLWQEAEELSRKHTPLLGVRTLDLLHVAAARVLRATHFVTFDTRQLALARAAGLRVN